MKICICTTPIRPIPTTYPPFGSMAIIQSLKKIDINCEFYNIDYFRYSREEVREHFRLNHYEIVAISAVVSTAYAYTKFLAKTIKSVSPNTIIILGGNLAASAEILLRFADIDFCVVGDGEFVIQDLVLHIKDNKNVSPKNLYKKIPGIAFIDDKDKFFFTGFGKKPTADEIEIPDYSILKRDGSLQHFIPKNDVNGEFNATVISAKGCVARCTFCHRWEKGYRVQPVDKVINHIKDLNLNHNVTHIVFGDENFGADREYTRILVKELGKLNITWEASGVRVRTVQLDDLKLWKKNGCTSAYFGIESGSPKILEIMEKHATLEENLNTLKLLSECKIQTIIQLVLGMPGEDNETINETINYLNKVTLFSIDWNDVYPSELISINYAQALPGTPLYEWAREKKFLGNSLQDEENYLIKISDVDAYKEDHFINYTGFPLLQVLSWRPYILSKVDAYYTQERLGIKKMPLASILTYYIKFLAFRGMTYINKKINLFLSKLSLEFKIPNVGRDKSELGMNNDSGYFNIHSKFKFFYLLLNPLTAIFFRPVMLFFTALKNSDSISRFIFLYYEYFIWLLNSKKNKSVQMQAKSLRKVIILKKEISDLDYKDPMDPLRLGR